MYIKVRNHHITLTPSKDIFTCSIEPVTGTLDANHDSEVWFIPSQKPSPNPAHHITLFPRQCTTTTTVSIPFTSGNFRATFTLHHQIVQKLLLYLDGC